MEHKKLDVWKESIKLVSQVYKITRVYPKEEVYGLTSQIRRAAVSVPSNIAEGAARHSDKELIQFLYMALGSLSEVETQVVLSVELKYLSNPDELYAKITKIKQMLLGLIRYLKGKKWAQFLITTSRSRSLPSFHVSSLTFHDFRFTIHASPFTNLPD